MSTSADYLAYLGDRIYARIQRDKQQLRAVQAERKSAIQRLLSAILNAMT